MGRRLKQVFRKLINAQPGRVHAEDLGRRRTGRGEMIVLDPLKWLLKQLMQYLDILSSPRSSDSQLTTGPADP